MIKRKIAFRLKNVLFVACVALSLCAVSCTSVAKTSGEVAGTGTAVSIPPGETAPAAPATAGKLADQNSSKYFTDLGTATAAANAYIDYLQEKGIITGYQGSYYPAKVLSRADLAAMLYGKYKYATEGFSYGDVPTDAYYYQAVMRGKASKVFEDTKYFNPDEAVTREQAAIWMYNSEILHGMPTEMASADVSVFTDAAAIADGAKKAVATMTKLGILAGDAAGRFNPKATFTRAEIAEVLYRLLSLGGGAPGAAGGPGGAPGGGGQTVDHGSYASKVAGNVTGITYTSVGDTENALRVEGKVTVKLADITINKTAGAAGSGDSSNFYGSNAGLLALDGADVTIDKAVVNTTAKGANGIFAYGSGTRVTVNGAVIRTSLDSSGGIMVTGGGTMYVNNSDIDTKGGSSAALRTDRGGGTLVVKGGTYTSHGMGSPAIYCTADITASDATLSSTTSEAVVVEGKNSVALKDCVVTGKMIRDNVESIHNVMIYQSMSGDAAAGRSSFIMEGGSLTAQTGDMFYVTNTACSVKLSGVVLKLATKYLLKVVGNDARTGWGVVGKNGGQCGFVAENQELNGQILVDKISTLDLSLTKGTSFSGTINSANEGGQVAVTIDATSTWSLTGDAWVTSLKGSTDKITTNGHKLYVDGKVVK